MAEPDAAVAELAAHYRFLAESEFAGYCDLYARIARAIADDRPLLERIAAIAPKPKLLPVLLNAAVHDVVLREPDSDLAACYRGEPGAPEDPWPLYRALLVERFDELADLCARRSVQTNEVGRSSVLLPALGHVHRTFGRPLSLIELGPSAGLNLLFDRFGYSYDDGVRAGDPDSTVQLSCAVVGDLAPPRPAAVPPVRSRLGIDLAPIDVTDPDACRWLEACLWPRLTERAARLRAALALARTDPPDLLRGDLLAELEPAVRATDPDTVVCVTATWVLAYLSHDARAELGELLGRIGAERDLAVVTCEYPGIAPGVDRPDRLAAAGEEGGASLVGLRTWRDGAHRSTPLAWCHAHGSWIDWLDPASAG